MPKRLTFRSRLNRYLIALSLGGILLLSFLILVTAIRIILNHFEGMAKESTVVAGRFLAETTVGISRNTEDAMSFDRQPEERYRHALSILSKAFTTDRAILFDRDGSPIASLLPGNKKRTSGVSEELASYARTLLTEPANSPVSIKSINGFWVGVPILSEGKENPYALFIYYSMAEEKRLVVMTVAYLAGLTALLAAFALVLSARMSRFLSGPLQKLSVAAEEFGSGDLEHRIDIEHRDEFGEVGDAFNSMAASLQESMREAEVQARQREHIESELRIAAQLQASLLPKQLPEVPHIELAARSQQAREVGGDFYDVIFDGERSLYVAIGDATNKGLPAAIHVTQCASAIRTLVREGYGPAQVLRQTNTLLHENLGDTHRFVTLFLAQIDIQSKTLRYCSAGHNPPILLRASMNEPILLESDSGLPLGLFGKNTFEEQSIELASGDILFLYTDGLTEAMNSSGELLGEDRVIDILRKSVHMPPDGLLQTLIQAVENHQDGVQMDDLTMLALRVG